MSQRISDVLFFSYSPGVRGGGGTTALIHVLVQFDWRQHLSPRAHLLSESQPVVDSHEGIGFGTGHSPGLEPL